MAHALPVIQGPAAPASDDAAADKTQHLEGHALLVRLFEIGLDKYVELPQIVAAGAVSCGKSSLLSALSGVAQPTASKRTTCCPTRLILSHGPVFTGTVRLQSFKAARCAHEESIASVDDVPHAIAKLAQLLKNEGQDVSDDVIVVKLRGPSLPSLVLTDLPGLVRVVTRGEDKGMIKRSHDQTMRFVKSPRAVLLAVVAATTDIRSADILQIAQDADVVVGRAIGVVTKLDQVFTDAEHNVEQLLLNMTEILTLGYHAVLPRRVQAPEDFVHVEEGDSEQAFFEQHGRWSKLLPQSAWGVAKLTDRLVTITQASTCEMLPSIMAEIDTRRAQAKQELDAMGPSMDSPTHRRKAFIDCVEPVLGRVDDAFGVEYDVLASYGYETGVAIRQFRTDISGWDYAFVSKLKAAENKISGLNRSKTVAPGDFVIVAGGACNKTARVTQVRESGEILCAGNDETWLASSAYKPHKYNAFCRFVAGNRQEAQSRVPSYKAFCDIVNRWVDEWEPSSFLLLEQFLKVTLQATSKLSAKFKLPRSVSQHVQACAQGITAELRVSAHARLIETLTKERYPYAEDAYARELKHLCLQRLSSRLGLPLPPSECAPPDEDQLVALFKEVVDTAHVDGGLCAYFLSSATRLADSLIGELKDKVLNAFCARLRDSLLGTVDDELERLMREPVATRSRRRELEEMMTTLDAAKAAVGHVPE